MIWLAGLTESGSKLLQCWRKALSEFSLPKNIFILMSYNVSVNTSTGDIDDYHLECVHIKTHIQCVLSIHTHFLSIPFPLNFLYPPQTVFVGGYTVFTLSVRTKERKCVHDVLFP